MDTKKNRYISLMDLTVTTVLVMALLCCGCDLTKPVLSRDAHSRALSNHTVNITSYEIPTGIFRGVLWPEPKEKSFVGWVIDKNRQEHFFSIPAPPEFVNYAKNVTQNWNFKISETLKNQLVYIAENKDKSKIIQLDLPRKKREYDFSVLRNSKDEELLIFMDTSEDVFDKKGFFGYVSIR